METLALIEPKFGASSPGENPLATVPQLARGFHIILTSQPRGSIPTNLWGSSYLIFINSL